MRAAQDALKNNDEKEGRVFLTEVMGHLEALGPTKKQPGNEYVALIPSPTTISNTDPCAGSVPCGTRPSSAS
jgi:hypothetical protein